MVCVSTKRLVPSFISESFQDGGRNGWVAVLGTFTTWFFWIGTTKGLAVMLSTLQVQFNTSTWLIGWMIAIIDASAELVGPIASPLRKRFGLRAVVMTCGLLTGISFIVASLVSSLAAITTILSLFAGTSFGIANITCREMIGHHFHKSYTFAFGIAGFGSSFAFLVFAPLTQFFLDLYGWRGTMMLTGSLLLHMLMCGALVKKHGSGRKKDDYEPVKVHEDIGEDGEERVANPLCLQMLIACSRTLNLKLFKSTRYWFVVMIAALSMTMHSAWIIYFVPHTNISKGFSLEETAIFVVVFGVGKAFGNAIVGILAQTLGSNGTYLLFTMSILVTAFNLCVDPWLTSNVWIEINVFVYGLFMSVFYILLDVVTRDAVGVDLLGNALGWISLKAGIIRFAFLFFPGLIYDIFGSYTLAFILMGGVNGITVLPLIALLWLQRRRHDND